MLCRATKLKSRHKYHSNTELHNIQQYSFPPNQMKRQLNMNNMFSKCPRLHIRAHRGIKKQKISFKALSVTTWRVLFQKAMCSLWEKEKSSSHGPPCKYKCGRASLERCSVECTTFKKIIFNAFNHLQNVASLFYFTCTWMEILFWTETLVEVQQTRVRDPGPLCERNRCGESETGEEEILKALEHHQTGKTPTHNRAEKRPQIFPSLLKCQFVSKLHHPATPPPPQNWTTLLLLSIQIHMSADWTSGRACSPSLWSFHFTASDSSPKCRDIYLVCDVPTSPLLPSETQLSRKTHRKETLHMESKRQTRISLDGRILVFGCKCSSSTWGS